MNSRRVFLNQLLKAGVATVVLPSAINVCAQMDRQEKISFPVGMGEVEHYVHFDRSGQQYISWFPNALAQAWEGVLDRMGS